MVVQHHERLDGSGYPNGLKSDAILREAKILAVADVVEAMMSHRPYRPALGIEAALAEIEQGKGRLYDPASGRGLCRPVPRKRLPPRLSGAVVARSVLDYDRPPEADVARGAMLTTAIWPTRDYSRVPYRLYHDAEAYGREQERIFRGPTWNFLCLEAEIPNRGDFRATWVGDTPVIVNRDAGGTVHAFVNRCAHRGAMVRRELSGNAQEHVCIYHQWCYRLDGSLSAIPFRRGIRGKGGLDPDFDMAAHGLRKLNVGSVNGAVFGTLADDAEPLEDYLGAPVLAQLRRLFDRPVRVLGYNRQRIRANWKLYAENTRDNYHASLLHEFLVTFGLDRSTQVGGVTMDARHRHNITWAEAESDTPEIATQAYGDARVRSNYLTLREPELVRFRRERGGRA